MRRRYKYLNYVPKPINLEPSTYKLVNDEAFCTPDGRIPLLMVTQFGVFPSKGTYKEGKDYSKLEGLENQIVGFIRRGYLSNREYNGVIEMLLNSNVMEKIINNDITIDFKLWN